MYRWLQSQNPVPVHSAFQTNESGRSPNFHLYFFIDRCYSLSILIIIIIIIGSVRRYSSII